MTGLELTAENRAFITRPPRDLAGWRACFEAPQLPVLRSTAEFLEEWRLEEDSADAHGLAETLATDPLMMLKLLAHVAELRRGREGSEPETATEALVMLGITPFFRAFGPQPVAEDWLAHDEAALAGFHQVLRRSHRAANFAIGFAVHRLDHDAAVIHEAALLHDFAELLLWLHAPDLALEIQRRQQADSTLRSAVVQREVLGIELAELQHALMQAWRLPSLLVQITDDHASAAAMAGQVQLRNVLLAIRVARHSAQGWDNAALPDDFHDIAELLHLSVDAAQRLVLDIDAD
jgi:HD-like signal output (HDOD) protein